MDTIINNVAQLVDSIKTINANAPIVAIIPQYTEGFDDSHSFLTLTLDIEDDSSLQFISIYTNLDTFYQDVYDNLSTFNPAEGGDDQYYDYNPSQLESIIYGAFQMPELDQAHIFHELIQKLTTFIKDSSQDPDMVEGYQGYIDNTIGNKDIKSLQGIDIYNKIKQSL